MMKSEPQTEANIQPAAGGYLSFSAFPMHYPPSRTEISFFKDAPISIWIEDLSGLKSHLEMLKRRGIKDFRDYFDRHPEQVVFLAKEIRVLDVNDATLSLYEAKDKEECLKGLRQVFSKESYVNFKEGLIALAEGKREFQSEVVDRTVKGEKIHCLLKLVIPRSLEDTWAFVLVYITDITDLRTKMMHLGTSEEKYRRLFKSAYDPMVFVDIQTGIFVDANDAAGRLIGIPPKEIVGMHFTEIHPAEEAQWYKEDFARHVKNEKSFSDHLVLCDKKGKRIPVSVSSNIIDIGEERYSIATIRVLRRRDIAARSEEGAQTGPRKRLSEREFQVLRLIAKGYTNGQIASDLCISEKTVGTHRTRIMQKLNLHRTADLVRHAMTLRLIE